MPSLNTRLEVARAVASPLIELEQHLDTAIQLQSKLLIAAIEGRRKARLPLHSGQEAIERINHAAESMIAARKAIHDAHLVLREIRDAMGVGPVGYGDHGDTPLTVDEVQVHVQTLPVLRAA